MIPISCPPFYSKIDSGESYKWNSITLHTMIERGTENTSPNESCHSREYIPNSFAIFSTFLFWGTTFCVLIKCQNKLHIYHLFYSICSISIMLCFKKNIRTVYS